MKLNKLFLGLLGMAAFTFAACSDDDDDYSPASVSGSQVYFSNEAKTAYEIDPAGNSFQLPILRGNAAGELTVPLKVEVTSGSIFTVANSATFTDGEKEAAINVSYDPANIEYGRYDTISVAIDNASLTTPYGNSSITIIAGVTDWGEWKYWNDSKTADYYYSGLFFSGDDPDLTFTYRHNLIKTNLYQFRLNHWGYNVDLVLDYDEETGRVTIPKTYTGYTHSTYGEEFIADYATYLTEFGGTPTDEDYGTFDETLGIITIPIMYYDTEPWDDHAYIEKIYIDGYTRADLTASISYAGKVIGTNDEILFLANVVLGDDVTSANVAFVSGKNVSNEQLEQIIDGTYEGLEEVASSGEVKLSAEGFPFGYYTLVVVPFNGEEAVEDNIDVATFRYTLGTENWNAIGTGVYTYGVAALSNGGQSFYEGTENATLYQSDLIPSDYYLKPWAEAEDGLVFNIEEDGYIRFTASTGEEYSTYGEVYFIDLEAYNPAYTAYLGRYDATKKTYTFNGAYFIPAAGAGFGLVSETFTLTGDATSARVSTPWNRTVAHPSITLSRKSALSVSKKH